MEPPTPSNEDLGNVPRSESSAVLHTYSAGLERKCEARKAQRNNRASPYARPDATEKRKSGRSVSSVPQNMAPPTRPPGDAEHHETHESDVASSSKSEIQVEVVRHRPQPPRENGNAPRCDLVEDGRGQNANPEPPPPTAVFNTNPHTEAYWTKEHKLQGRFQLFPRPRWVEPPSGSRSPPPQQADHSDGHQHRPQSTPTQFSHSVPPADRETWDPSIMVETIPGRRDPSPDTAAWLESFRRKKHGTLLNAAEKAGLEALARGYYRVGEFAQTSLLLPDMKQAPTSRSRAERGKSVSPAGARSNGSSSQPPAGAAPGTSDVGTPVPELGKSRSSTPSGRMLTKNPNGIYQYRGVASARQRPRPRSPTSLRAARETASPPPIGTKKRRVGSDSETSIPQPSGTAPDPQPAAGSSSSTTEAADDRSDSTKRAQTSTSAKPPTQTAINATPAPPAPPALPKSTRAATVLTELIGKVAPRPKAEITNPWETATPAARKQKTLVKKTKEQLAKEREMQSKKSLEHMSAQEIIEITTPKTGKRGRSPSDSETSSRQRTPELFTTGVRDSRPQSCEKELSPDKYIDEYGLINFKDDAGQNKGKDKEFSLPAHKKPRTEEKVPSSSSFKVPAVPTLRDRRATVVEVEDEDDISSPYKNPRTEEKVPRPSSFKVPVVPTSRDRQPSIVEIEDEDDISFSGTPSKPTEIVEPSDEPPKELSRPVDPAPSSSTSADAGPAAVRAAFGMKARGPKPPSKLRFSVQPEQNSDADSGSGKEQESRKGKGKGTESDAKESEVKRGEKFQETASSVSAKPAPSPSFVFRPKPAPSTPQALSQKKAETKVQEKPKADTRATALKIDPETLPSFVFREPGVEDLCHYSDSINEAMDRPQRSLPRFEFSTPTSPSKPVGASSGSSVSLVSRLRGTGLQGPVAEQKKNANGKEPKRPNPSPKPHRLGKYFWKCMTCGERSPITEMEKCAHCGRPKHGEPEAPADPPRLEAPSGGFDWAAAGMKKPDQSADKWTCSLCNLANPITVTKECSICGAPKA